MKYGSLINYKLLDESDIVKSLLSPLMYKGNRRQFSLLESPITNLYTGEVSYKVFLCGKSGSGKTATVSNASGKISNYNIAETTGIQATNVYWPVMINETKAVVLFKISFWDVGESVLNNYNHILPSCMENVDCVLYVFSHTNKSMWDDLPRLITRIDADDEILKIAIGTKTDLVNTSKVQVTTKMIKDFEQVWKFPVINISNKIPREQLEPKSYVDCFKISSEFMNRLCELLWYRDQVRVGLVPKTLIDFCFQEDGESELDFVQHVSMNSPKGTKVTFC